VQCDSGRLSWRHARIWRSAWRVASAIRSKCVIAYVVS